MLPLEIRATGKKARDDTVCTLSRHDGGGRNPEEGDRDLGRDRDTEKEEIETQRRGDEGPKRGTETQGGGDNDPEGGGEKSKETVAGGQKPRVEDRDPEGVSGTQRKRDRHPQLKAD